ncbi:hypothetical protein L9F63_025552, partial [Diploptera punctata]
IASLYKKHSQGLKNEILALHENLKLSLLRNKKNEKKNLIKYRFQKEPLCSDFIFL